MSRPEKRKLWACDDCGVTFVSSPGDDGTRVSWEKHGGGIRRTVVTIVTEGACPACGTEDPSVTPVIPQS